MATWTLDPTFYPSPRLATQAPPETLAYVASLDPTRKRPDVMAVVDLDSESAGYGRIVGQTDLAVGDEVHHFGWNACSSCLCPYAPHPHVERRYLIVPGIRSSRLHVLDTKPNPAHPKLIRTIEAEELAKRAGYSRPHTTLRHSAQRPSGKVNGGVYQFSFHARMWSRIAVPRFHPPWEPPR
jgi:selenium-binding protein 1